MKAMTVNIPGPIEEHPLALADIAPPEPAEGEILVRVKTCGVCRTDLHVSEGDLPMHREHVIPGHEVVGVVERLGAGCKRYRVGERVGIAWLRETCGICIYCKRGRENLCPNAKFTGYDHDGGYCRIRHRARGLRVSHSPTRSAMRKRRRCYARASSAIARSSARPSSTA